MSSDPNSCLEDFVQRFFTCQGADVEKVSSRLDVLAPPHLAMRLGIPDFCTIRIGAQKESDGHAIHYGSPLLEKLAESACDTIPLTIVQLDFHYIKKQGFDRLIQDLFAFRGATVRVEKTAEFKTEYLLPTCRYLAQSDEQKEGLVTTAFNLETGAPAFIDEAVLATMEKTAVQGAGDTLFDEDNTRRIIQWVQRRTPKILEEQIETFRDSMNRRFRRDVASLEEYYTALSREMEENLSRPGLSEQLIQERKEKIRLIPDEMAKKKEDLFKKYSIKVKIRLSAALLVRTPAVKLFCRLSFGRGQRNFTLFYNPINKSLDPIVCTACGEATFTIHPDRELNLLCPSCGQKTPTGAAR